MQSKNIYVYSYVTTAIPIAEPSTFSLRCFVHSATTMPRISSLLAAAAALVGVAQAQDPQYPDRKSFFKQLDTRTWVFGNELWNVTQGPQYAKKLYFQGKDLVGDAWGHYVSYSTYLYLYL
jgi:hypothetical protein